MDKISQKMKKQKSILKNQIETDFIDHTTLYCSTPETIVKYCEFYHFLPHCVRHFFQYFLKKGKIQAKSSTKTMRIFPNRYKKKENVIEFSFFAN